MRVEKMRGAMNDRSSGTLQGLRVLVVEDEHLVALALADDLEEAGAIVVGPAASVEGALGLIAQHAVDAAVRDIKLQAQMVFPVADVLAAKDVPFLFTSGFDAAVLPAHYADVPTCDKPASPVTLMRMLADLAGRGV
jgi:two-component SAPR family response regulator